MSGKEKIENLQCLYIGSLKKILKQPQSKLTCKVQKYDTERKIENKFTEKY